MKEVIIKTKTKKDWVLSFAMINFKSVAEM